MKKISVNVILLLVLIFLSTNYRAHAQEPADTSDATLEETMSWIQSKVNEKMYKISYEYVSCADKLSKTVSATSVNCHIRFEYDISKLTFSVTSTFATIWTTKDSIVQPSAFTLYLSDISAINLVCYKDTVYKETREYENTDQKGNEIQTCEVTNTMYSYCSMFFTANGKKYEMLIPDEFIYIRLLKAFNHAVGLVKKTEKF
ncbi:MAG TPA: hypothetical protein PLI16_00390 [Bacteroidales bacterium]|nr:hypothetical protein [Bacteroidales bacterium]HNZ41813.1 hypothetical protein [Bacteroidales bacterium]HOH83045.1 hypothetical protein [Bacteroidales bacterium]HPB24611.1 hypothetical protein [Bacteroidales bacterium]HPI29537.1 hypothetical protein [Bacteroidales bacterium]